jgi:hypothetical protein
MYIELGSTVLERRLANSPKWRRGGYIEKCNLKNKANKVYHKQDRPWKGLFLFGWFNVTNEDGFTSLRWTIDQIDSNQQIKEPCDDWTTDARLLKIIEENPPRLFEDLFESDGLQTSDYDDVSQEEWFSKLCKKIPVREKRLAYIMWFKKQAQRDCSWRELFESLKQGVV